MTFPPATTSPSAFAGLADPSMSPPPCMRDASGGAFVRPYLLTMQPASPPPAAAVDDATLAAASGRGQNFSRIAIVHARAWMMAFESESASGHRAAAFSESAAASAFRDAGSGSRPSTQEIRESWYLLMSSCNEEVGRVKLLSGLVGVIP